LDFREVQDLNSEYAALADYLHGRGVPSIEEARKEIFLRSVLEPYRTLVNAGLVRGLRRFSEPIVRQASAPEGQPGEPQQLEIHDLRSQVTHLLTAAKNIAGGQGDVEAITNEVTATLDAVLHLPSLTERFPKEKSKKYRAADAILKQTLGEDEIAWAMILAWVFTYALGKVMGEEEKSRKGEWGKVCGVEPELD
jgi:hypothetical protein